MKHQVYKWFSEDGSLLYVGRSINAMLRASDHKSSSSWYYIATTCKITTCDTIEEAKWLEKFLIQNENPIFNITSNCSKSSDNTIIDSLSSKSISIKDFISKVISQEIPLRKLKNDLIEYETKIDYIAAKMAVLQGLRNICRSVIGHDSVSKDYGIILPINNDYKLYGRSVWYILDDVKHYLVEKHFPIHKSGQKGLDIVFKLTGATTLECLISMYKNNDPRLFFREELVVPDFSKTLIEIESNMPY